MPNLILSWDGWPCPSCGCPRDRNERNVPLYKHVLVSMSTPTQCPTCGNSLPTGAPTCLRCGSDVTGVWPPTIPHVVVLPQTQKPGGVLITIQVTGGLILGWTVNVMLVYAFSGLFRSLVSMLLCGALSIALAATLVARRRSPFAWAYLISTILFLLFYASLMLGVGAEYTPM